MSRTMVLSRRDVLAGFALLLACKREEGSSLHALGAGFSPLARDFSADAGRRRVVALLSPT